MPEESPEDSPESEPENPEATEHDFFHEDLDDEEKNRLVDQYIHYSEVAIETSSQRIQTNRTFGIILTTLLAGLFGLSQATLGINLAASILFASAIGAITCHYWYGSIQSYRRLNNARYTILNKIEEELPAPVFSDEWKYLKKKKPDPEMIDPRDSDSENHRSHTIVERRYIRLLQIGYVLVGSYALVFVLLEMYRGAWNPISQLITIVLPTGSYTSSTAGNVSLILSPLATIVIWEIYRYMDSDEGWSISTKLKNIRS
ncbi:hypothetical protein ACFR9U_14235 [Halorientalis brevis]|uniref:DUF4231 domain-containing protein n=1 Tax=Halorientalis brevis TaxID=1126241 RepID=A0ABD6CFM7_9EURY|nr:hypothetical protein [Halorientalis brevis]